MRASSKVLRQIGGKGQVPSVRAAIPKPIAAALDIQPGDEIIWIVSESGRLIMNVLKGDRHA